MNKKGILINFAKVYNDYLAECDVYDGASLWSSERAIKCLNDLDQVTISKLDKCATKIEEETYTENREEDNLVEHIVNEIRKFVVV